MTTLRNLPSVEGLLQTETAAHLIARFGRPLTLDALRVTLDETRARLKLDPGSAQPTHDLILARAESTLSAWTAPTLVPLVNATGVILHTNLGRAPLSAGIPTSNSTLRQASAVHVRSTPNRYCKN
jgi:L-seryl-tRNA(Ser) seleniumtransferase